MGCPLPGDLPNQGIEPMSPALAGGFFLFLFLFFFTTEPPGKPSRDIRVRQNDSLVPEMVIVYQEDKLSVGSHGQ